MSEQRRALLLPQEVKELGTEDALVFYEGLRPIRCRKIRYFSEKRFGKRLFPAPNTPVAGCRWPLVSTRTSESAAAGVADDFRADPAVAAPLPPEEEVVIREGTVADIERIESLTLENFAADFSKVEIPIRETPLSEQEMKVAVDTFLQSLERI